MPTPRSFARLLLLRTCACLPLLCVPLSGPALLAQATPMPSPAGTPAGQNQLQQLAATAERRSQWSEAADAYLQLVKAEPMRTDFLVAAARCLGRGGRYREAIDLLIDARKRFPEAIEVRGMLARTHLMQGESDPDVMHPELLFAEAADLAEGVLQAAPNDEDSRLVLAHARYMLGERDEAIRQANEAVQRHPQRAGAHILLGRIHLDRFRSLSRRYAQARPEGQEAADMSGEINKARQEATACYQRAAALDPNRGSPHVALAQMAVIDGKTDAMRQHLLDALVADPNVGIDHEALGEGLDWHGREALYRQALERYGKGTTATPAKSGTLRFYIGRCMFQRQEWQACRDAMQQALAENPAASSTHWFLFLCAYRLDDHDTAERHASTYAVADALGFANTVRDLHGDQRAEVGAIVRFLADRAYAQKRIEASRDLNHVTAFLHDTADAWNNHAFLCRETGKFAEAASSYGFALQREPESPQLWNDAAVIYQYHLPTPENLAQAKQMYGRALQFADKLLGDGRLVGAERERAQKAKADALANLAELDRK